MLKTKKIFYPIGLLVFAAFLFNFSALAYGQRPADGIIELRKLEGQILDLEESALANEKALAELRVKYSDEYAEVKKLKDQVAEARVSLASLYLRRRELLSLSFNKNLPLNQTDLLKIIIIQNERIIKLLERSQPR